MIPVSASINVSSIRSARPLPVRHVALAFAISQAHLHLLSQGITDYARQHARWLLTTSAEAATLPIKRLRHWKGDGVIASITTPAEKKIAAALQKRGIHVVTMSGALRHPGVPRVKVDNLAIGRMAADHLLECGFKNFAFFVLRNAAYSFERGKGFLDRIAAAGFASFMQVSPHNSGQHPWQKEMDLLNKWIQRLQTPVGIFAANDFRTRLVIDACQLRHLRVPQDVGVIGVDNNQLLCEYTEPKLSSIVCDWHAVGFQVAQLLDKLMRGERAPLADITVLPRGIMKRASTDITVVNDADLAHVIQYIRGHISEVFGVERLIDVSGISRRALETAFLRHLKCTPYRYLCLKRIERAKELLESPEPIKLSAIARHCGFHDVRRFRIIFRRIERLSPAQYRNNRAP